MPINFSILSVAWEDKCKEEYTRPWEGTKVTVTAQVPAAHMVQCKAYNLNGI